MDDFDDGALRQPAAGVQVPISIYRSGADCAILGHGQQYVLAEHMFTTQGGNSFTAHQDLIAGDTRHRTREALVNLPSCAGSKCVWGCDAPKGTHTSLITQDDEFQPGQGPFPASPIRNAARPARRG